MRQSTIRTALIAAALLLASGSPIAAENNPAAPGASQSAGNAGAPEKSAKAKGATAKKPKPVDINSASKAELKKLTGVDDAMADKIIAGRPYLSKAHLVTRNIMPHGVYEQNKKRIVAIQKPAANKK